MTHYYRSQFVEAKEKYLKLQQLQNELEDNEDSDLNMSIENSEIKQKNDLLYGLHADLTKLKSKLALFENPILRPKRLHLDKLHNEKCFEKPKIWLVFDSNKQWDEYMRFMENVKHYCADIELTCNTATSLQQAFDELAPNDIIYIGSGTHIISGAGNFAAGSGTIINVDCKFFVEQEIKIENLKFVFPQTLKKPSSKAAMSIHYSKSRTAQEFYSKIWF